MATPEHPNRSEQTGYEFFLEQVDKLEAGFPQAKVVPLPDKTVQLYFDKLKGFSRSAISEAVDTAIDEDDFFPSFARLRRLADANEPPKPIDFESIYR